MRITWVGLDKL